jgi:hypothetical protein
MPELRRRVVKNGQQPLEDTEKCSVLQYVLSSGSYILPTGQDLPEHDNFLQAVLKECGWPKTINLLSDPFFNFSRTHTSCMCNYVLHVNNSKYVFTYSTCLQIFHLYWLVLWNMTFIFPIILGMSSSQLTNSYFSEGWVYHQPVDDFIQYYGKPS